VRPLRVKSQQVALTTSFDFTVLVGGFSISFFAVSDVMGVTHQMTSLANTLPVVPIGEAATAPLLIM